MNLGCSLDVGLAVLVGLVALVQHAVCTMFSDYLGLVGCGAWFWWVVWWFGGGWFRWGGLWFSKVCCFGLMVLVSYCVLV